MFHTEDVIHMYQLLETAGIPIWLTGGWGIDALLGEQTRPHKDLDVIMLVDDVARMRELLDLEGYNLKEVWSENRWTVDARGAETATAFVLRDADGREIDAHALRLDEDGNGLPAWDAEGCVLTQQDLTDEGVIAGLTVRCFSPEMQVIFHTGYDLPEVQLLDMARLRARFNLE